MMFYLYTCILRGCVLDVDMLGEVFYNVLRVYVHSERLCIGRGYAG
jgi:hypothetical protein